MAIVRVRHPKGVLKIDLPQNETKILWIYEKIATELAPFYPEIETFWISLDPKEPEKSRLIPTPDSFISFSHGQLIYLHLKSLVKAADIDIINSNYSEASLDEKLRKNDGKIIRKRDERLCRHGQIGMCEHCQPLEPYDLKYLESHGIKHLSFYSWLKKLKDSSNTAIPITSLLETPKYSINLNCPYHAPFPEAVCTKCQPSAIILRQQPFRMVDHVEIVSPKLIDEFLGGWRSSGFQRFGWLVGKYAEYSDQVPLGIKGVVEYIYEPPQDGSIDGFQLLDTENENENENVCGIDPRHWTIFKSMKLEVIGMIYTDLIDDGTGTGKVQQRRSKDTFFVSGSEILFIADQQSHHPFYYSSDAIKTKFSSRFVTVVVSGEADGDIGLKAYQVSDSAVSMKEANLIAATTDPSRMLVRQDSIKEGDPGNGNGNDQDYPPLYVPQVFYKFKNNYGIEVQKAADPLFPVEYLLVTLSEGIPLQPTPLFKAPLSFPPPLFHPNNSSLVEYFKDTLHLKAKELAASQMLSNANLLLFLSQSSLIFNETERKFLCKAISTSNAEMVTNFIDQSKSWQNIISAISESVAMSMNDHMSSSTSWTCKHCTFVNVLSGSGEQSCDMCGLPQ